MITAFENITGTEVRDCVCSETVYFLVNSGKIAKTIGRNGQTIKTAEKLLRKSIKVFEWNNDNKHFIKNMIPQAQSIEINENRARVTLESKDRGAVIGRKGCNIKMIREFLERNSDIKELKIL